MTQRPVPAARYSRLLTQDDSPDSTHKAPADISPLVTLRPSLPTTLSFLLGILSTAIFLTIFKPPLSSTLCVTSYHHDTTFTPHPEYANLSIQYDALWQDLLPSNGGFLIPLDAGSGEGKKGITMFHQLHCLQLLRIGLQKVHHGAAGEAGGSVEMAKDMKGHSMHANDEHYLHCLDYLRQTSLCAADHTQERTIDRKKPGRKLVDGYVKHRCGDSQALYELVASGGA